jgi:Holliday junction resolvasome RuvABC DNA-binding subunit
LFALSTPGSAFAAASELAVVGSQFSQRIVIELGDQVDSMSPAPQVGNLAASDTAHYAIRALISLVTKHAEADKYARNALAKIGEWGSSEELKHVFKS